MVYQNPKLKLSMLLQVCYLKIINIHVGALNLPQDNDLERHSFPVVHKPHNSTKNDP